jgi:excisionase family DNA binding protein
MSTVTPTTIDGDAIAYRPRDAARVLGIGRSLLYELLSSGQIRSRKFGQVVLIPRSELERFVAELPVNDTWGAS